ncbi:MAG: Lrp/AsnC family transcriptional regulator, partial [Candidatus Aenigmarchaeota archaeon]|nr:Lrp/AsnC family transcriptional regulator [Candidatus Aenigmarchaeota archaeon]
MYKLNDKDIAILRELGRDSRKSFRIVARKLGIATTTVIKRYNKLKELGIIKHSSLVVDYEKLGYSLSAIIELTVSKGKLVEVEEKIAKKHNAFAVYDVTGDTDAMIIARFRSREE